MTPGTGESGRSSLRANELEFIRSSALPFVILESLASNLIAEFGRLYPTWNLADAIDELTQDAGQGLPLHIAAIEKRRALGSASVISDDEVTGWKGSGWWLANVFVVHEYRGRGIGSSLINRAIAIARESGARDLHLVTDTEEDWYLKQGWERIGLGDVHGNEMVVMHLKLPMTKRAVR